MEEVEEVEEEVMSVSLEGEKCSKGVSSGFYI